MTNPDAPKLIDGVLAEIDEITQRIYVIENDLEQLRHRIESEIAPLTLEGKIDNEAQPEPFWVSWPIEQIEAPRVTNEFDMPRDYANGKHEGTDCDGYVNSQGRLAKVLAAQDGIVEYVVSRAGVGYGNHVVIRHPWGNDPNRYRTLYAHMTSIHVKVGDVIKRSDVIGIAGNSGTQAVHLHFNVHDTVSGLRGYLRCVDCSAKWPDGVIDPMLVMRLK